MKIPALIAFSSEVGMKNSEESKVFKFVCLAGLVYFLILGVIHIYFSNTILSSVIYLSLSFGYLIPAIFYPHDFFTFLNKPYYFYALSFIGFNSGFVFNGGILSPSIYLLFPFILVIIYLTDKRTTTTLLTLIFTNYIILFTINYYYPNITVDNSSLLITIERVCSHILSLLFSMMIINKIFSKYKEDKFNAKKSEKAKEAFLANMSHLVRTPLNGINGFSDLLLDDEIPDFEKEYFKKKILSGAKELHHMIFNLIDLSVIEEKSLQLRPEYFSVHEFVQSLKIKTKEEISHIEKSINLDFKFKKPDDIQDFKLFMDGDRLFQLIWNFLENSINHTVEGEIKLLALITKDLDTISFTIEDNGVGMTESTLDSIINQNILDRNQSTVTNPTPGMGILISKGILNYFGGSIDITSKEDFGTNIHIEIPIKNRYEISN